MRGAALRVHRESMFARLQAMTKTVFPPFPDATLLYACTTSERARTTNAVIATKARSDTPSRAGVVGYARLETFFVAAPSNVVTLGSAGLRHDDRISNVFVSVP